MVLREDNALRSNVKVLVTVGHGKEPADTDNNVNLAQGHGGGNIHRINEGGRAIIAAGAGYGANTSVADSPDASTKRSDRIFARHPARAVQPHDQQ